MSGNRLLPQERLLMDLDAALHPVGQYAEMEGLGEPRLTNLANCRVFASRVFNPNGVSKAFLGLPVASFVPIKCRR